MIPHDVGRRVRFDDEEPPQLDSEAALLREELAVAQRRIEDLVRAHQAAQHTMEQEAEAFRRRLVREREQLLEVERGRAALLVLEAIDELDLCLKSSDHSPLANGVRLIRNGLVKRVEESGVERIALDGTLFDPRLAEAGGTVAVGSPAEHQRVVEVIRNGYAIAGKVVRPGRVVVGRYAGTRD